MLSYIQVQCYLTDIVCYRFPTPVHAVLHTSAVLPHRQTLCATVSLHLYMLSYIQMQCYPTDIVCNRFPTPVHAVLHTIAVLPHRHCELPFPHTCTCCPTYKCSATPQTLCVTRHSRQLHSDFGDFNPAACRVLQMTAAESNFDL